MSRSPRKTLVERRTQILDCIARHPGIGSTMLAYYLEVSSGYVFQLCKELANEGLIQGELSNVYVGWRYYPVRSVN